MIITFVTDLYFDENNGTSISAKRFTSILREHGHTVKIVAVDDGNNTEFAVKERSFGKLGDKIIHSQGMRLADPDEETLKNAIKGSDIVHIYMPFKLGKETIKICRELNVPCTAAFHIAPENITSTIYLGEWKDLSNIIYRMFYKDLYRYVKHIHCPSLMIANKLKERKYRTNLHVISNGYHPIFKPENIEKPEELKDKFIITFIGRFSCEKRHDLIIKAVSKSKYKDKIQLIFGGKGPKKNSIVKKSMKLLPIQPRFEFFTKEELVKVYNYSDLYVHPADTEIEGISCIEAIACGLVPIVSNSIRSATPQFTIDERCIFKRGDYNDLSKKIDYWIEHQDELKSLKEKYAKHALNFNIENSVKRCEKMFEEAIKDWDNNYNNSKDKETKTKIFFNDNLI